MIKICREVKTEKRKQYNLRVRNWRGDGRIRKVSWRPVEGRFSRRWGISSAKCYRERSGRTNIEESFGNLDMVSHPDQSSFVRKFVCSFFFLTWGNRSMLKVVLVNYWMYGGVRLCTASGWIAVYIRNSHTLLSGQKSVRVIMQEAI